MSSTFNVSSLADLDLVIEGADGAPAGSPDNPTIINLDLTAEIDLSAASGPIEAINLQPNVELVIDGNGFALNGNFAQRGLFVYAGDVTIKDLTIEQMVAQGGAGASGGGGGAGLGGGLS